MNTEYKEDRNTENTQRKFVISKSFFPFIWGLIRKIFTVVITFLSSLPLWLLTILVVLLIIFGAIVTNKSTGLFNWITRFLNPPPEVTVASNLLTFQRDNILFTSFSIIDIVETKKGYLKREVVKEIGKSLFKELLGEEYQSPEPTATVGYCKKTYEIGIGYRNVHELILNFGKRDNVLLEELPEPEIISINPVSSEVRGKFSQSECDALDQDTYKRLELIKEKLGSAWNNISRESKQTLYVFINIFSSFHREEVE